MKYYKAYPDCGAALDLGEKCDCKKNIDEELRNLILELTADERVELLEWIKKNATLSAANTQSGMVEQIATPVSVPILPENQNKDKGIYND